MVTIPLLEQISESVNITLADFFAEKSLVELTPEKKALINDWCSLTTNEQAAIKAIIKSYRDKQ